MFFFCFKKSKFFFFFLFFEEGRSHEVYKELEKASEECVKERQRLLKKRKAFEKANREQYFKDTYYSNEI